MAKTKEELKADVDSAKALLEASEKELKKLAVLDGLSVEELNSLIADAQSAITDATPAEWVACYEDIIGAAGFLVSEITKITG